MIHLLYLMYESSKAFRVSASSCVYSLKCICSLHRQRSTVLTWNHCIILLWMKERHRECRDIKVFIHPLVFTFSLVFTGHSWFRKCLGNKGLSRVVFSLSETGRSVVVFWQELELFVSGVLISKTSKVIGYWWLEHRVVWVFNWPACSLDLSPVENMCHIIVTLTVEQLWSSTLRNGQSKTAQNREADPVANLKTFWSTQTSISHQNTKE